MKLLFVNANLNGHINPTLGMVKALTQRGNQVDYFCSASFSEQVNQMGARRIGYSNDLDIFFKNYRPTDRHPFYMLLEYILLYDEVVLPEIMDIVDHEQYDMIICDSIFGGGCFLKQMTTVPIVCSHSSFAMSKAPIPERMFARGFHPQLDHCYEIVARICEKYNIQQPSLEQVFTSKGDLNIVYTTREFNGDEGVNEPEYIFAGPSINRQLEESDLDLSILDDKKLIYISLGSINTDFLYFYKMCIATFCDTNYYVCMSIGKKINQAELGEVPSNFMVNRFLPQLEILKKADVFITHAGFNSVNEALYYGVPMLALPQVNDQHMVSKRLVAMQLGITEDIKVLTPELLRDKVEALISDKKIKENCMQISLQMKNAVKTEQVVLRLEEYIN
ncbi:macrolide family glycosyltransferase [Anaerosporobacter faecicola]|uniref:macrolide family glycosyltransferase n=1 Tax=Anaerosporobacter faecicola TaxID=2718714 RepID=UPI00143BAEDA|nr:macrolide family glycosyltransferase [Anaerosporobacter faecicola]